LEEFLKRLTDGLRTAGNQRYRPILLIERDFEMLGGSKGKNLLLCLAFVIALSLAQEDDEFATAPPATENRPSTVAKEAGKKGGDEHLIKTEEDDDDDDDDDKEDEDETLSTGGAVKVSNSDKMNPTLLPPLRTGQPIFEYAFGVLTFYFLINYIVGRLTNGRRVKALSTILTPILKEQFSSVGIKATDAETGFSVESDSEYSGFSSGRKNCVGALVSINLAPRQDLFRSTLGMFFSAMRTRDSISIEIPLSSGDAFFLAVRAPVKAQTVNNPFGGAAGAANPFTQPQGFELVNEEACNELERNPKTLKSFYRSIKTTSFLSKESTTNSSGAGGSSSSNSNNNSVEDEGESTKNNEVGRSAPTPSRAAVALDELEILLEQKDIVSMSYLGGALRSFIFNAALLQSGGVTAMSRMGAPLPPARFRLHITDLPDLCHGFKTAHLCSPEGGRVTLIATLALPASGGSHALSSYLPQAVHSMFAPID